MNHYTSRRPRGRAFLALSCLLPLVLLCLPLSALCAGADGEHHSLWSLKGKTNTVYLLGSVHFLKDSEQLPAVIDAAYADAEALVMELDMDDLDPTQVQQLTQELGVLPPGQSLEQQLGKPTYDQFATKARAIGIDAALLEHFQPWFAAMTIVQVQLLKLGLDPSAGVELRLTRRATSDGKPITGFETMREQLELLAHLPATQQREFLLYSVDDAERTASEIDRLLAAWRRGDTAGMAALLAEGFDEYPDLYRPLTVDRNRKWVPRIEALLDDRNDYLIVVGALHLVGKDSVIELLERAGHKVQQL